MDFKNRLKQIRHERGISQTELAKFLRISKTVVSDYESDTVRKAPSIANFIKIAEYLNLSTDYLLGITDNPLSLHSDNIQLPLQTAENQFILIKSLAKCVAESNMQTVEYTNKFSQRLRQLRQTLNVSIRELSSEIIICSAAISAYENKERMPSLDTLIEMARYFHVSVDYLLCLTDNPFPIHNKTEAPYLLKLPPNLSIGQIRFVQRMANDTVNSRFDI